MLVMYDFHCCLVTLVEQDKFPQTSCSAVKPFVFLDAFSISFNGLEIFSQGLVVIFY